MMTIVAWPQPLRRFNPERRIGAQTPGFRFEPKLQDDIRAGVVARWLQYIVLNAGDVRDEGEAVRRVGRNRVGARCRLVLVNRLSADSPIRLDWMHRHRSALVIG